MVMVDSEEVEMGEFGDVLEVDTAGMLLVGALSELAFGGEIAEVLIYNRALSEPERGAVRGYLGSSYGLFVTDNQAPIVTLTAPNLGATVKQGNSLLLKAEAVDADGNVAKVLFFSGGTELGLDESAPYELEWTPTTEGEHLLTAVAVDNRGGETISDVVTVRRYCHRPIRLHPRCFPRPLLSVNTPLNLKRHLMKRTRSSRWKCLVTCAFTGCARPAKPS